MHKQLLLLRYVRTAFQIRQSGAKEPSHNPWMMLCKWQLLVVNHARWRKPAVGSFGQFQEGDLAVGQQVRGAA